MNPTTKIRSIRCKECGDVLDTRATGAYEMARRHNWARNYSPGGHYVESETTWRCNGCRI